MIYFMVYRWRTIRLMALLYTLLALVCTFMVVWLYQVPLEGEIQTLEAWRLHFPSLSRFFGLLGFVDPSRHFASLLLCIVFPLLSFVFSCCTLSVLHNKWVRSEEAYPFLSSVRHRGAVIWAHYLLILLGHCLAILSVLFCVVVCRLYGFAGAPELAPLFRGLVASFVKAAMVSAIMYYFVAAFVSHGSLRLGFIAVAVFWLTFAFARTLPILSVLELISPYALVDSWTMSAPDLLCIAKVAATLFLSLGLVYFTGMVFDKRALV